MRDCTISSFIHPRSNSRVGLFSSARVKAKHGIAFATSPARFAYDSVHPSHRLRRDMELLPAVGRGIMSAPEAERDVAALRSFNVDDVGGPEWTAQRETLERLNIQVSATREEATYRRISEHNASSRATCAAGARACSHESPASSIIHRVGQRSMSAPLESVVSIHDAVSTLCARHQRPSRTIHATYLAVFFVFVPRRTTTHRHTRMNSSKRRW